MVDVSPPPQEDIPAKFAFDPDVNQFFIYIQRALFDLWQRTGGGDDFLSVLQDLAFSNGIELDEDLFTEEPRRKQSYIVTANHTTVGDEYVEAGAELTVFLNPAPTDDETVDVKMSTINRVTVDGNGKTINDETTILMNRQEQVRKIVYSIESDGWDIR